MENERTFQAVVHSHSTESIDTDERKILEQDVEKIEQGLTISSTHENNVSNNENDESLHTRQDMAVMGVLASGGKECIVIDIFDSVNDDLEGQYDETPSCMTVAHVCETESDENEGDKVQVEHVEGSGVDFQAGWQPTSGNDSNVNDEIKNSISNTFPNEINLSTEFELRRLLERALGLGLCGKANENTDDGNGDAHRSCQFIKEEQMDMVLVATQSDNRPNADRRGQVNVNKIPPDLAHLMPEKTRPTKGKGNEDIIGIAPLAIPAGEELIDNTTNSSDYDEGSTIAMAAPTATVCDSSINSKREFHEQKHEEEGPTSPKVARIQNLDCELKDSQTFGDSNLAMSPLNLPNHNTIAMGMIETSKCSKMSANEGAGSPVAADDEIRKNLMALLSPSQSSSLGSLSTQISPSTCSPDPGCDSDSGSMNFDDSGQEQILCYPTFEEMQQSNVLDSPESISSVLREAVLQNVILTRAQQQVHVSEDTNNWKTSVRKQEDIEPGVSMQIINCQVPTVNPAFTTPNRPWLTKMAPPQGAVQPRRVHFVNLLFTPKTSGGSVLLPAKGTPHPTHGTYIPGQGPPSSLGFQQAGLKHQTPTGYIIRHQTPLNQKVPNRAGVSPHASPANISLNSSGEEMCNTSPEEVTPPPRVPNNTPQSGFVSRQQYPLTNRFINESNILAQLEANVKNSPKTLEGFANLRSPFPAESISKDASEEQLLDDDSSIGRDHHNAKERNRRARIKNASDKLRKVVPGLSSKTDKATAFELAVEYILFMKQLLGKEHDRQFIAQCNLF